MAKVKIKSSDSNNGYPEKQKPHSNKKGGLVQTFKNKVKKRKKQNKQGGSKTFMQTEDKSSIKYTTSNGEHLSKENVDMSPKIHKKKVKKLMNKQKGKVHTPEKSTPTQSIHPHLKKDKEQSTKFSKSKKRRHRKAMKMKSQSSETGGTDNSMDNQSRSKAENDSKVADDFSHNSPLKKSGGAVTGVSSSPSSTVKDSGMTENEKQHKKRKATKKKHDGTSNWMKLCSKLNIDATVRKTKPVKRPAEPEDEKETMPESKRAKPDVWFDDVDEILIEAEMEKPPDSHSSKSSSKGDVTDALVKPDSFKGLTSCVAMDCEMVGVGPKGEENMLARVSIVNHFGVCLYDKFVLPREKVTDYRTFVSGVTEEKLAKGEDFLKVQKEVSDIIHDRMLVGHALHNDLKVLFLTHPHHMTRDTQQYKPFRELFSGRIPSLKKLTDKVLGVAVQEGQHSSVQDAQATMRLYTMYRQRWEKDLKGKRRIDRKKKKKKKPKLKE